MNKVTISCTRATKRMTADPLIVEQLVVNTILQTQIIFLNIKVLLKLMKINQRERFDLIGCSGIVKHLKK